jgi:hypothetical protein
MMKRLFILCVLAVFIISCNNTQNPTSETNTDDQITNAEIAMLTIVDFDNQAGEYVGKEIQIAGLVNHTCKHGGKKMFLIDETTEQTVKIEAGENISSFDAELEGSVVLVNGIVTELIVDETYLAEWEKELQEEMENTEEEGEHTHGDGEGMHTHGEGEETHSHGEGEEGHEHVSSEYGEKAETGDHMGGFEKIEKLRKQIAESGKDHLSFYSVECISYTVEAEEEEI